jgi:hypothetical protein
MSGYVREFLRDAELLGFSFIGHSGSGHLLFYSPDTGAHYSAAYSPSDWRSRRNAIAQLERLSGRRLPRHKNGKHRHRRQTPLDTTLTPVEQRTAEKVAALQAEAEVLRRRVEHLAAQPTRAAAAETRCVLTEYEHLRRRLAQLHHIIDPIEGTAL